MLRMLDIAQTCRMERVLIIKDNYEIKRFLKLRFLKKFNFWSFDIMRT